jgi:hypothetical protein
MNHLEARHNVASLSLACQPRPRDRRNHECNSTRGKIEDLFHRSRIGTTVIDGLGVLASIAEAVPVLGAPVKGSVEALKQIVQYTQARAKRPSPRSLTTD